MKKNLLHAGRWLVGLVGVLILVLVVVDLTLGSIVKMGIETVGSRWLGVPVSVRSVSVSPLTGRATLAGLKVGNPTGYLRPTVFEVKRIEASFELTSLWGSSLKISRLRVESPRVHLEGTLLRNNLSDIQATLREQLGLQGCRPETKASIAWLKVDDTQATLLWQGARHGVLIHPADVEMAGLGTRGSGLPLGVLASKVLERIATNTLKQAVLQQTARTLGGLLQ